jgi:hypothetical protein
LYLRYRSVVARTICFFNETGGIYHFFKKKNCNHQQHVPV